jgi:hypothetical protein
MIPDYETQLKEENIKLKVILADAQKILDGENKVLNELIKNYGDGHFMESWDVSS